MATRPYYAVITSTLGRMVVIDEDKFKTKGEIKAEALRQMIDMLSSGEFPDTKITRLERREEYKSSVKEEDTIKIKD